MWLPGAGRDSRAFVVGTKVIQLSSSQCAVTTIYKQLLHAVHISVVMVCDGLLE